MEKTVKRTAVRSDTRDIKNREVEDIVFRYLLMSKNKNYQWFCEEYNKLTNDIRKDADGNMNKAEVGYSSFFGWFTRRGLKFRRVVSLLRMIGFRIVIVPSNARVAVVEDGWEAGKPNVGYANPVSVPPCSGDGDIVQCVAVWNTKEPNGDNLKEFRLDENELSDEPEVIRSSRKDASINLENNFKVFGRTVEHN